MKIINSNLKSFGGFTLIETLIYIGVIAMAVTSFVSFGLAISERGSKSFVTSEVNSNGLQAMQIIAAKLREADTVVTPTKSSSDTALELDMPGTSENTAFQVSNGYLQLLKGLDPAVNLTGNFVTVTDFNVINNARGNRPDNITVSFTASYKFQDTAEFTASQDFETTVTLRK